MLFLVIHKSSYMKLVLEANKPWILVSLFKKNFKK